MSKKFNKKILINQCGLTKDEADIVINYQQKLPIIWENEEIEGFCINVRELYKQLLQTEDMSNFSRWIKRAIKNYKFEENVDFTPISPIGRIEDSSLFAKGGDIKSIDYWCTIDMAKSLCMVDKTDIGALTRRYFMLMEKSVKRFIKWNLVRTPLRQGYVLMDRALNDYMNRNIGRSADEWDYKYEANALNIIATGFTAQEIRFHVGATDNITRDHLTEVYNNYLLKMQELDTMYLNMNIGKLERYEMLYKSFNALFPKPVLLKSHILPQIVEKNKQKLLNEVREKIGETE